MTAPTKDELRTQLSAARRAMSHPDRAAARADVRRRVLDRAEGWGCVAAYEPLRTEPGSTELLAGLAARGVRVLVPVTLPDRDLDWTRWGSPDRLGPDAVATADAVLVPALAVAPDGTRLGRGGGSYDRALRRATPLAPRIALIFDGELLPELPADPWDQPVTDAVAPGSWTRVGGTPGPG